MKVVGINFVASKVRRRELEALSRAVADSAMPRGLKRDSTRKAKNVGNSSNVRFVTLQEPEEGAKNNGKQFALGMIEITAHVKIDFELAE